MKKIFLAALPFIFLCSVPVLFQGCVKDTYQKSYKYTYYQPVYKTTAEVRANIKSNAPQTVLNPGKIFILGSYIFLNDIDRGIHVIDNADPYHPHSIAFIDIPGNMDMAVKGNTLYADLFTDLVAIDITNPAAVALKKVISNVFPIRYYNGYFMADGSKIIVDWEKRDTVITQKGSVNDLLRRNDIFMMYAAGGDMSLSGSGAASVSVSPYGVGGSMARFTVVNQRLYTVGTSALDVFNISSEQNPVRGSSQNISQNIETIYPFKDKLFIGSQSGMFIYNISNPDQPVQQGNFGHVQSCDPVIADDQYAYVTLRSGTRCQGFTNELEILKLNNINNPSMVKIYPMAQPHGLSKDGNTLFICDGSDGLKIYDAADVNNLQLIKQVTGIDAYDVIAMNGKALVVAKDGLYQYDYSNRNDIRLLSKITITH